MVIINGLIQKFSIAYDAFVSSQSSYSSVTSRFSPALVSIESSFSESSQYLSQFYSSIDLISDSIRFKNDIIDLSLILNSTLNNIMSSYTGTKQVRILQCFEFHKERIVLFKSLLCQLCLHIKTIEHCIGSSCTLLHY